MPHVAFPRSTVLVVGSNSAHSVVPSTLIAQAESLLDAHRIPEAVALVQQHRRKLQAKAIVELDEVRNARYIHVEFANEKSSQTRCATYTNA